MTLHRLIEEKFRFFFSMLSPYIFQQSLFEAHLTSCNIYSRQHFWYYRVFQLEIVKFEMKYKIRIGPGPLILTIFSKLTHLALVTCTFLKCFTFTNLKTMLFVISSNFPFSNWYCLHFFVPNQVFSNFKRDHFQMKHPVLDKVADKMPF